MKSIYFVDCFDHEYWFKALSLTIAEEVACRLCGHNEINESFEWGDSLAFGDLKSVTEVEEILGTLLIEVE